MSAGIARFPIALCFLATVAASAAGADGAPDSASPPDLGFANFFTAGWSENWAHRHDRYSPDMALLRVVTNALEKELRMDLTRTDVRGNPKVETSRFANALIAYAVNRRLMVEVISNYQWNEDVAGATTSGGGGGGLVRLQLTDSRTACTSFQVRVSAPNKGLNQTQTTVSYAVASWQDVHALLPKLGRFGVYESIQVDTLSGPANPGAKKRGLAADVSIAKTWTDASRKVFKKLTTFAEFYATHDLDGPNESHTVGSFTPGIRNWFSANNSVTLGVDLPLGQVGGFYRVVRFTYIFNF